jgi:hypothetical protein
MTSSIATAATATVTMVSHSMWWHSTIAEVYVLNALFMFVGLGMLAGTAQLQRPELRAFFFVCGLAFFQHVQLGILLAGACVPPGAGLQSSSRRSGCARANLVSARSPSGSFHTSCC